MRSHELFERIVIHRLIWDLIFLVFCFNEVKIMNSKPSWIWIFQGFPIVHVFHAQSSHVKGKFGQRQIVFSQVNFFYQTIFSSLNALDGSFECIFPLWQNDKRSAINEASCSQCVFCGNGSRDVHNSPCGQKVGRTCIPLCHPFPKHAKGNHIDNERESMHSNQRNHLRRPTLVSPHAAWHSFQCPTLIQVVDNVQMLSQLILHFSKKFDTRKSFLQTSRGKGWIFPSSENRRVFQTFFPRICSHESSTLCSSKICKHKMTTQMKMCKEELEFVEHQENPTCNKTLCLTTTFGNLKIFARHTWIFIRINSHFRATKIFF